MEAELAKCEVLCRRCHAEIHTGSLRIEHGSGGYRRGCRCEVCRRAKAAQMARYRVGKEEMLRLKNRRYRPETFRDKFVVAIDELSGER